MLPTAELGLEDEYLRFLVSWFCHEAMTSVRVNRVRDWQQAGVWDKLHHKLLEMLHRADRIDWSRAVVDSTSVRSVSGGTSQGPTLPTGQRRVVNTM